MSSRSSSDRPVPAGPILVVDDDRKIVALVRAYLEREGYRVVVAHDGAAALRRIREDAPALVVLDVMLPETDGLTVAHTLRAAADPVPILMLSARSTVPDRIRGLERGADDYLTKPFSPAELVARVRTLLRRAAPVTAAHTPAAAQPAAAVPAPDGAPLRHADLTLDLARHGSGGSGHRTHPFGVAQASIF